MTGETGNCVTEREDIGPILYDVWIGKILIVSKKGFALCRSRLDFQGLFGFQDLLGSMRAEQFLMPIFEFKSNCPSIRIPVSALSRID